MRLAAYTATSVGLASCVILNALHQRTNFYSASVYLAQSSACLMILTNGALLLVSICMLGLQKLLYGPLRPIEVEQLYEKAWFAITETCLAMTIFREEVGGWFLVMFVSLLIGKVWGWIGEGRVEILEQQPPSNPTLFHARLSISLLLSAVFDVLMLAYSIKTVLHDARPNMMVMFAFEFAVLCVTSTSTIGRYLVSLREAFVIQAQTNERRAQILSSRNQRTETSRSNESLNERDHHVSSAQTSSSVSDDMADIDVPGWEAKGRWIFYLELATDFFKLILYLTFFCVLCMFYGMPIHIIRDVALTIRSFHKRLLDFIRYRQATHDMNARYPDATPDEVGREDCCIICREDMTPWPQASQSNATDGSARPSLPPDERFRPKKLPCGHVLHFACLKSWLERQQTCPTCRTPVLDTRSPPRASTQVAYQPTDRDENRANAGHGGQPSQRHTPQAVRRPNVFQLGPLRIVLGGRDEAAPQNAQIRPTGSGMDRVHAANVQSPSGTHQQTAPLPLRPDPRVHPALTSMQLYQIEQNLLRELNNLHVQADQLLHVRLLQNELMRQRSTAEHFNSAATLSSLAASNAPQATLPSYSPDPSSMPQFAANPTSPGLVSGDNRLPSGVTIPEGWTLLPLRPVHRATTLDDHHATSIASDALSPQSAGDVPPSEQVRTCVQSTEVQRRPLGSNTGESVANGTAAALPQWGSGTAQTGTSTGSPASSAPPGRSSALESPRSQMPHVEVGKGKGKAATVEDGQDGVD